MPLKISPESIHHKIRDAAYRLLAVRAYSAGELQRRLMYKFKYHNSEIIDEIITDLQTKDYLNDEEFARQLAREKRVSSAWGPGRIRRELRAKYVAPELTEQVVAETFAGIDQVEALMPIALKRWRLTEGLPDEARHIRLSGFLDRRGYSWEVIHRVIQNCMGMKNT